MDCPECGSPLSQEQHLGIQLDTCDECRGLWFDHGELEAYWTASRSVDAPPPVASTQPQPTPAGAIWVCPRCASDTLNVRRVDVFNGGTCSACFGVWLGTVPEIQVPRRRAPASSSSGGLVYDAVEIALELAWLVIDNR